MAQKTTQEQRGWRVYLSNDALPHHTRLWQVGVDFSDAPTPIGAPPKGVYFTVRWRPPYKFSMLRVSDTPSAAYNREDREADDGPQTLFR